MEDKKRTAYLPIKDYVAGKEALAKIEVVKEYLQEKDYITPEIVADILGFELPADKADNEQP